MKKYIAIGLVLALMVAAVGCKNQQQTEETTVESTTEVTTEATVEETVMTNEQGQILDENGNVIETQVSTDESGNTVVVDNSGNKIEKNASGGVVRKTTAGKAKTGQQPVANNNKGTKAKATQAPATQAPKPQPQTTKATTKATAKATTAKATTKATTATTRKSNRYYICNQCGYKVPVSKGVNAMYAHHDAQLEKYLSGKINTRCSGYYTDSVN